jgi:pilus assembly protein Flp/PilA
MRTGDGRPSDPWKEVNMLDLIRIFREREEGQALVEYALILALVSVAAIIALTALGTNVSSILSQVAGSL